MRTTPPLDESPATESIADTARTTTSRERLSVCRTVDNETYPLLLAASGAHPRTRLCRTVVRSLRLTDRL